MPRNTKAVRIPIPDQVICDYRAGLTLYQLENLGDWRDGQHGKDWGCLGNDKPVFYVPNNSSNPTAVLYFGHNPNFRIPAILSDKKRASTPLDFVPENLRTNPNPDLADAIFGWVEEAETEVDLKTGKEHMKVIGIAGQCAGRVSFCDAHFEGAKGDVWYKPFPITPKILANPKVTTFQHYLVQDKKLGHDPDKKISLVHYGTSPAQTSIRGHKFYWHKGSTPEIEFKENPKTEGKKRPDTQLTQIVPLNHGVRFSFKIHFENLRPEEMGVLCWVLMLPGEEPKTYRHKIGMGKPLGMGAVKIDLNNLHLTRRQAEKIDDKKAPGRYDQLIDAAGWYQPELEKPDPWFYIQKFKDFMSEKGVLPQGEKRIQELLEMLQWRGEKPAAEVLDATRYMEIEREVHHMGKTYKVNEYKERPVLPSPLTVFGQPVISAANNPPIAPVNGVAPVKADPEKSKAETKKKPPLVNLPPAELQPGHHLLAIVVYIDKNNDVFLKCTQHGEEDYCVIRAEKSIKVNAYSEGKEVRLEVISVKKERDGWLIFAKKLTDPVSFPHCRNHFISYCSAILPGCLRFCVS